MSMTVKQQLHSVIDNLDDASAVEVLAFALGAVRHVPFASSVGIVAERGVDVDRETLWQVARPITDADPFWSTPGLLDDDGPADVSSDKHRYLAEIYGDLHNE
jgi:hypothetical protein